MTNSETIGRRIHNGVVVREGLVVGRDAHSDVSYVRLSLLLRAAHSVRPDAGRPVFRRPSRCGGLLRPATGLRRSGSGLYAGMLEAPGACVHRGTRARVLGGRAPDRDDLPILRAAAPCKRTELRSPLSGQSAARVAPLLAIPIALLGWIPGDARGRAGDGWRGARRR